MKFRSGMLFVHVLRYLVSIHPTRVDCGNFILNGGAPAPITDCDMPCTGNPSEACGAGNRLNVYDNGRTPPSPPIVVPSVGQWVSLGCYRSVRIFSAFTATHPAVYRSDNVGARSLPVGVNTVGEVTIELCTTACYNAGYTLAGAEYSVQVSICASS
jgi:hypothetical protein